MPSSGVLPNSGIKPESLMSPALAGRFYTTSANWKPTHTHTHTHTHTYPYIHMHTMGYYSAIKKNEKMPFAATWMDLEIIILSEVRQKTKLLGKTM